MKPVDFPTRGFLFTREGKEAAPDSMPMKDRARLESWGVVFGQLSKDKYFQEATLPAGWKLDRKGYWNYLRDDLGRSRASFFAKYAMYDYDVFGSCDRRFSSNAYPMHGAWEDGDAALVAVVTDGGKIIWRESISMADAEKRHHNEAREIADKQLIAMGLDKQRENWDLTFPILPESAQSKKYRAKRIAHFEEQLKPAKEELRKLRNTIVHVIDDSIERVFCPFYGYGEPVDNQGRPLINKRRAIMERNKEDHEQKVRTAEERVSRLSNTIEALKRGESGE